MFYPVDFADDLRRKPICGVLAVAIAANTTFAQATNSIKSNLMPWQKRHGGKTYHEQRLGALRDLGVPFRVLKSPDRMTLENWIKLNADSTKHYMIMTTSHVVTYKNGICVDQQQCCALPHFNARRCFVKEIVEIL